MSEFKTSQPGQSDPFAGHFGHLNDAQQRAFDSFKQRLTSDNLYTPSDGSDAASRPSHDDPSLLRFLRVRRFDPAKAQKQFADTEEWRRKHDVDRLYSMFPSEELESARRFYPRWTGRRDKRGRPVFVYRLATLAGPLTKELQAAPAERRYERIISLYEYMIRFYFPLCSALPHDPPDPIVQSTNIIDLEDVAITHMWTLRSHLQEASTMATANYPETLGTICVVNAPSFFPTIWGWIKGWFDEGTRSKIHILSKDNPGAVMRTIINAQDLPKLYGGELEWQFGDPPSLDASAKELIGEMPVGPAIFVDGKVERPVAPQASE